MCFRYYIWSLQWLTWIGFIGKVLFDFFEEFRRVLQNFNYTQCKSKDFIQIHLKFGSNDVQSKKLRIDGAIFDFVTLLFCFFFHVFSMFWFQLTFKKGGKFQMFYFKNQFKSTENTIYTIHWNYMAFRNHCTCLC